MTIGDILALDELADVKPIAPVGLDRVVKCVTVQEAPYSYKWLRGGELVLSSCYPIQCGAVGPVEWISTLFDHGAAGTGIMDNFLHLLPTQAFDLAQKRGFPVLVVPSHRTWSDVMQPIYRLLAAAQEDAPADGATDQDAAALLSKLEFLTGHRIEFHHKPPIPRSGWHTVPVRSPGMRESGGFLAVRPAGSRRFGEAESRALVSLFAFLQPLVASRGSLEGTFRRNFFRDLFTGRRGTEELLADASALGLPLDSETAVLVIVAKVDGYVPREAPSPARLCTLMQQAFVTVRLPSVAEAYGGVVTCLVATGSPAPPREDYERKVLEAHSSLSRLVSPFTTTLSVAPPRAEIAELGAAARQAREGLQVGLSIWGPNKVIFYDDLGVYRLLGRMANDRELKPFLDELARPLDELEEISPEDAAQLLLTVSHYFACNQSPSACARRLHVHPNTVRYRLHKLERLTHLSLDNSEDWLKLQIGLRVRGLRNVLDAGAKGRRD